MNKVFRALLLTVLFGFGTPALAQFGLTTAKTRNDADIYLSGAMVGQNNVSTTYQWDIKFSYPRFYQGYQQDTRWLTLSPVVEFTATKGTNANPDKVKLG